jgi:RNA polymerase-binding transcription factor DksA
MDNADLSEQEEATLLEKRLLNIATGLLPSGLINCQSCGDEIGKLRLEALPSAIRCISCESEG